MFLVFASRKCWEKPLGTVLLHTLVVHLKNLTGAGAGAAMKREEEGGELAHCTFAPRTGRGPTSGPKATVARLPAPTRLYAHHDSKYRQVCTSVTTTTPRTRQGHINHAHSQAHHLCTFTDAIKYWC